MKLSSVVICLILLCFLCGFGNALMIYQNDTQLIRTSDQIVYGKIVDVQSAWNAQKTHIETTAQVLVDEAFIQNNDTDVKSGTTVPVTVLGGTVGDIYEWVEDMPVFELNSDAFIYLEKTKSGKFTVHGLENGIHPVLSDDTDALNVLKASSSASTISQFKEEIRKTLQGIPVEVHPPGRLSTPLTASVGAPTISSISPSIASAGTDTPITITGSGFGTTHVSNGKVIFFAFANSYSGGILDWTGVNDNSKIDSWTDTQIKVRVPYGASSGFLRVMTDAGETYDFPFAVSFDYAGTKWDTSPTYYINPGSVSGATTAIQSAAATWNNAGSSFRLTYGGTSSSTGTAGDGISLISFVPSSDLPQGALAITSVYLFISGPSTGKIGDVDTRFNSYYTWTTGTSSGNTINIEAVMAHEFGHWLILNDLYGDLPQLGVPGGYPSDISPIMKMMFWAKSYDLGNVDLKTLSSADIDGIRWIYPPPIQQGPENGIVRKSFHFGKIGDIPVSGDWDGNGVQDVGVFRPSNGNWYLATNNGWMLMWFHFGNNGDIPVVGDWNGDGTSDVGVFRPSTGNWYLDTTKTGVVNKSFHFGSSGDVPVPWDWNSDSASDPGIFRPSNGDWYFNYTPFV